VNDDVRAVLAELAQEEGAAFYGDSARAELVLRERLADRPADVTALLAAVGAGVPGELLAAPAGLRQILVGYLVRRLDSSTDLGLPASRWAVETWAEALHPSDAAPPPLPPSPVPPAPTAPAPPSPVAEPSRPAEEERAARRRLAVPRPLPATAGALALLLVVIVAVAVVARGGHGPSRSASDTRRQPPPAPTTPGTQGRVPATFTVPAGLQLGTGDVQATLLWASGSDLDLHVVDPGGNEIYFSNPRSPTGGSLDHDDTAGCNTTGTHVENVFWPPGAAPSGRYRVFVKNYDPCRAPADYELKVTVGGQVIADRTATLPATSSAESPPFQFNR
jgi:hypothetical protein